jgi:hydroxyethylthiazole kinase-like uncharacterized protein yjeF
MNVLPPDAVIALEKKAFSEGVRAEALMEEAGRGMAQAIRQFFPNPGVCLAVFGKGHNGGDALVTARLLSEQGWETTLFAAFPSDQLAPLTSKKWDEAGRCETRSLEALNAWHPDPSRPLILLDGLLGIGSKGPLQGPVLSACQAIAALQARSHAQVFALDLPTGLDPRTGACPSPEAVTADFTLTVAFTKTGLLADAALPRVGRLAVIPLPELARRSPLVLDAEQVATSDLLAPLWKKRSFDTHKGQCGRVALIAGGLGCLGAAALCAQGALRSGAGLVTLWVPEPLHASASALAPRECMVRPYRDVAEVLNLPYNALGLGPGIGFEHGRAILQIIREFPGPAVIDADALTLLAEHPGNPLASSKGPRLLTPHPGEMERLAPGSSARARQKVARDYVGRYPVTLLLKGARSIVASEVRPLSFNPTGNPGMATGGQGDVLTGVCTGLLAQGLEPYDAARLGAWLCGRSAELLVSHSRQSQESLLAGDVADTLGAAFDSLRRRDL